MHCNLRPPDVTPVVMGFKYEAHNVSVCHNTPAFHFNNGNIAELIIPLIWTVKATAPPYK